MGMTKKVLTVLRRGEVKSPLPPDEVARMLGMGDKDFNKVSFALNHASQRCGVKKRVCPDDRSYTEYWLPERERELIFLPTGDVRYG